MTTHQHVALVQQFKTQKFINYILGISLFSLGSYVFLDKLDNSPNKMTFEEISVERINIVEKNGLNRMVLSNADKAPGVDKFGKEVFRSNEPRPGMIFYNDEGTENGGFIFRGKKDNGEVNHGLHMSFDRYNQDQTMMMQHIEQKDFMITGLTVMDRPDTDMDFELTKAFIKAQSEGDTAKLAVLEQQYIEDNKGAVHRAFYGTLNGSSQLRLNDAQGNKRIQLVVTESGEAKLEFLDDKGQVIMRLPENN
ncbi:hypothetical protein ACRWQN_03500 [Shewanella sp. HL-SH8]|uniref:hypothetical protein n=1 Tax=Shewanella sp. HL-SH8 TaxID=3436242 RepID=UPI003EBD99B5